MWLAENSKSGKRLSLSGDRLKSGYPMVETKPAVIGKFTQGSVADGEKDDKEAGHRPGGARFPGP